MIDEQLAALASDTRRELLLLLVGGPRSVGELADQLPVSRPAVSQHLKVLVDAGLATVRADGTRRVYTADPVGVEALRTWAERLWTAALDGLDHLTGQKETTMAKIVKPVVKNLRTPWSAAYAFNVFTARMTEWWPLASHSIGGDDAVSVEIEPRVGGQLIERTADGEVHAWGTVIEWEAGRHLAFTWHPGHAAALATTVDVRFRDLDEGSEILVVHTGWEVRGDKAEEARAQYQTGWDIVLGRYLAA